MHRNGFSSAESRGVSGRDVLENRAAADRILDECALTLHGYCGFDALSGRLLPCRAAAKLRDTFSPDSPAKTVIAVLFPYRCGDEPGNLSRYARVPDYHTAAGSALKRAAEALSHAMPAHRFISFIDNSPIPEVRAAALAGLGCVGDHGLLINPVYGSWVFIGTIITDMPVDLPGQAVEACIHCGACAESCPGGCADETSREACVSRVSQLKGMISPDQESLLKKSGMAWGCDRCQEVCPLNAGARIEPHPCFGGKLFEPSLDPDSFSELEDRAYGWRGTDVLKRNLKILLDDD